MSEADEIVAQINNELQKYESEIRTISKKEFSQKQTFINKCDKRKKTIINLLESFDMEINQMGKSDNAQKYKDCSIQFNKSLDILNIEFEANKTMKYDQNQLFLDRTQLNPHQMTAQQIIDIGHKTQKKGLVSLENTLMTVQKGGELADEIIKNLDHQIEQLDNMESNVKDTRAILNRSQKYVNYFIKQIYTDKLLMILICLIVLVVVTIIILSACGYTMKDLKDKI